MTNAARFAARPERGWDTLPLGQFILGYMTMTCFYDNYITSSLG